MDPAQQNSGEMGEVMKPSLWNVMRIGVGGVLYASLLAACADGRGNNGFKSYQYSEKQMAVNKAKMDAKTNALKNSNIPVNNAAPANNDTQQAQPASGGDTGAQPGKQAAVSQEAVDSIEYQQSQDAAKAKEMTEMGQEPVQASVKALRVSNDEAVRSSKEIPELKKLVKGVTVTSNMADKQLLLNIDAVVVIDGADHALAVQNAPLSFAKDGVTTALSFRLLKGTESVNPGKKLVLTAICKEETCQQIQIRFSFEVAEGKRAAAVVGYKLVGAEWQLMESNIGEVAAFDKGQESGQGEDPLAKAKAAEAAKNAGQNLTDDQKAALELQKSIDAAKKLEDERAKAGQDDKAAVEKKASEDAAMVAAFGQYEASIEKAAAEQAQVEKKASEDAATLAAFGRYESSVEQAAKEIEQKEAQQKGSVTPAAGQAVPDAANQGTANVDADGNFLGVW
jgi:hypothetical protein